MATRRKPEETTPDDDVVDAEVVEPAVELDPDDPASWPEAAGDPPEFMVDAGDIDEPAADPIAEFDAAVAAHESRDDEVAEAELVEDGVGSELAELDDNDRTAAEAAHRAIEAAASAALAEVGIPGRDEFLSLAMQARMLSSSNLVPKALKGNPADTFLVLLTGRDLGIPVTSALRKVYVVDGQTSLAPQLKCALVRRQGLGAVKRLKGGSAAWQGAYAVGPDGSTISDEPTIVAWQDVHGELTGVDCWPAEDLQSIEHSDACKARPKGAAAWRSNRRIACKDNWYNYPRRMLWWRAAGYCVDDEFPEVALGLYSPDELGAITDGDGVPIDVNTVELPPGYEETAQSGPGGVAARAAAAEQRQAQPAPTDELAALQERIDALPVAQRDELKVRWKANERLAPFTMRTLPVGELAFARSMLLGFESIAKRNGWDPDAALEELRAARAAESAQEPAEGAAAPDGQAELESAAAGDTAPDPAP